MKTTVHSSWRINLAFVCVIAVVVSAAGPTAASAAPPYPELSRFCEFGTGAGLCAAPRSVATDPSTGHAYVVDEGNSRISEFTSWGRFVKAWGWGVVASGPDNDPRNEVQMLSVDATGGTFRLRYGVNLAETAPIPFDASAEAVQSAVINAPFSFDNGVDSDPFLPGDVLVSGPNGGPWELEFVGRYADTDFGGGGARLEPLAAGLTGGAATAALVTLENGGSYEICSPAAGDVCRAGSAGSAPGQLGTGGGYGSGAQGIAVDSAGDIYVVDRANHRVQKYDSDGNFLLMFGGQVNTTTGEDLCTQADLDGGDVCEAAQFGNPGAGEGQFGSWELEGGKPVVGDYIDVGPDQTVYVGDTDRIQKFSSEGSFLGQIAGVIVGNTVQSLASDSTGDLYVSFTGALVDQDSKADVRRVNSAGAEVDLIKVPKPRGLVVDGSDHLFVLTRDVNSSEVIGFDADGDPVDLEPEGPSSGIGGAALAPSTGIAVSSPPTCGLAGNDLIIANPDPAKPFLNIYGPAPDPDICEQPQEPPTILAQFAQSVETADAVLRSRINPHFWPDTRYFVQYGTTKCSDGGCTEERPASPGSLLTDGVVDAELLSAAVFLTGLQPGTTYHYRFVAESGGGGPVVGPERTFKTLLPSAGDSACPNDQFRTGPSAKLPDCRAYEMVSPVDKANGDISGAVFGYGQAAVSGDRVTFGSLRAFADPEGAPFANQFLASRQVSGWATDSISPPRSAPSFYPPTEGLPSFFKAFSPDLCSAWVLADTDYPLAAGAPGGVPNFYRRDNCGSGSYELLTTTHPPGFEPVPYETYYFPTIQGWSADASRSVLRANAALAVAEGGPRPPFICTPRPGPGTVGYQWLRNGVPIPAATAAIYRPVSADDGASIQCQATVTDAGGASLVSSESLLVAPVPATAPPSPGVLSPSGSQLPGTPEISGIAQAGETLTCEPGRWSGSPAFTFAWFRNAAAVPGATEPTFVPAMTDKGMSIQCRVIGTNPGGSAVADSERVVVAASPPLAATLPSIAGTPAVGEPLDCDPGTWQGSPTFSFQWLRNGANIAAATASQYTLVAADEGKAVQCRVNATNSDATVGAASLRLVVSPPPGVEPPNLVEAGSVTGGSAVGDVLTCTSGNWGGTPALSFRWLRNGANILGATSASYTLVAADLGKAIQCQVTAANAGGTVVSIYAAADVRYPMPAPPPVARDVVTRGNFQLYVTDGASLRLVSVLPDGSASSGSASVGTAWAVGFGSNSRDDSVRHATSEDATRVFWTARPFLDPEFGGEGPGALYLRVNALEPQSATVGESCTEPGKACTITVSASSESSFVAANPSGSRVIYMDGDDLYEAEIVTSGGETVANSQLIAGGTRGVMGTSDDVNRVYFVSTQVLTGSQANSEGALAQPSEPNLYLYERGAGFAFVATLAPVETQAGAGGTRAAPSVIARSPLLRISRVSPDGLHAAFVSTNPLTGVDNADKDTGDPNAEVFVYDASADPSGTLTCVSCSPSGARAVGREIWANPEADKASLRAAAILPGWNSQFQPSPALSSNGARVFFNSFNSLAPGDSNGKADVYQWELAGEGSCSVGSTSFDEASGGCVRLISSGSGGEDSEFLDATPSGSDVFFFTQSSLVTQDIGSNDVYDARIGGGFAAPTPPPSGCEGQACQGSAPPPAAPAPPSESFRGPGNPKPPSPKVKRCPKGKHKVKRNGKVRCVKTKGGKRAAAGGRASR